MKRFACLVLTGLVMTSTCLAQPSGTKAPINNNPKVEIKGKIERIRISRGQGTPSLEVKTGERTVSVGLGSMRYLLEQNFNPKAGEEVAVSGYKVDDKVVAITVTLSATGKILRLRDDAGWPVWAGGRRGPATNRATK